MRSSLLLLEFFRLLDARNIRHCVMGDSRGLPDRIASDVDIVVPQSAVATLPRLVEEFCAHRQLRLAQCLQHEHNAYYFVIAFREVDGKHAFLAIDLCGDYYRRGRKLLDADELLSAASPAVDEYGREKGFAISAPALEFCYYLIKKVDKEQMASRHSRYLTHLWRLDAEGCKAMVDRYWKASSNEARLLSRAAESGDWSAVARLLPRMRAALHRRVRTKSTALLREYRRRWRRWRQPTGLTIALLGPDGCGKSSVIVAANRNVREAFRDTIIVHLRPGFLYRPERVMNTNPHGQAPRGRVRSTLKLLYFAADYVLGHFFFVRPRIVRSHALLFDRYYDDLIVDPLRYRHRGSPRLARLLRAFVPRPDLWLLLDAPAEILQSRKQEVPWSESERQRLAYRKLLNDQKNVVVLDATRPLEEVVDAATGAILAACESRTRARLQLPNDERRSPLAARWLLLCCRRRIPLLSKLTRLVFNCDIYCDVPRDLYLPHPYGIVIHSKTRLGRGVTVMQQATLGGKDFNHNVAPIIGDNAYIGAGARVLGNVTVGAGAIVGANAVVTRDVPAGARVVGANRILQRQQSHSRATAKVTTTVLRPTAEREEATLTYASSAPSGAIHR